MKWTLALLAAAVTLSAQPVADLKAPVEILRDKWGVPHIYAQNSDDLFFAQGWITAKDRLFQIDLWRRVGSGHLAEVLGPSAVPRDRIARLVRFRGDWEQEWQSYSPDAKAIVAAFVNGINACIKSLNGSRPLEFQLAGYDPALWAPEDVVSRVAGLLMTRNATSEVARALDIARFGAEEVERMAPPDPFIKLALPKGLDIKSITRDILKDYTSAVGEVRFPGEQGSNNWVVDASMTTTGMPLLANDPHRPIQLPSLRKTVHLVAPGWNVIGAGEPALPGVALGHNQQIAYGFTIVGIDQQDLFVERVNPANPAEYMSKGKWTPFTIEHESIAVKGGAAQSVELKFTVHGPVLYEANGFAYALKWVGAEPGGAGYLPALRLARARNWYQFLEGVKYYHVPSENLVYADRSGNIGWIAAGEAPIRKGYDGLLPVPGDTGDYDWTGYLPTSKHPQLYNPPSHHIATANHNILPSGYAEQLGYEWANPIRFQRIEHMLQARAKFSIEDFERMQQDVLSEPALRFQKIIATWQPAANREAVDLVRAWDGQLNPGSRAALIYEMWLSRLPAAMWGAEWGSHAASPDRILDALEKKADAKALESSLDAAMKDIEKAIPDPHQRVWGTIHKLSLRHPLNRKKLDLEAIMRPGDANTVNAASGPNHRQTNGPSYRQIIDLNDWDNSVMTNVPGESGDPNSKHYSDLLNDWANGVYHPMPFTRAAVEAAMEERILLEPGKVLKP